MGKYQQVFGQKICKMGDDLVERLREPCFERGLDELWIDAQRIEAADRIEELEAKYPPNWVTAQEYYKKRADKAEVKNAELEAKLREAALSELSALGQASDAYTAQLDAEAKLSALSERHEKALMLGADSRAKLKKAVEALRELIDHTHNCEKELTEKLHNVDFCGESMPLTSARAALSAIKREAE
jgi:hypothetical protein